MSVHERGRARRRTIGWVWAAAALVGASVVVPTTPSGAAVGDVELVGSTSFGVIANGEPRTLTFGVRNVGADDVTIDAITVGATEEVGTTGTSVIVNADVDACSAATLTQAGSCYVQVTARNDASEGIDSSTPITITFSSAGDSGTLEATITTSAFGIVGPGAVDFGQVQSNTPTKRIITFAATVAPPPSGQAFTPVDLRQSTIVRLDSRDLGFEILQGDDGCNLARFATNLQRCSVTVTYTHQTLDGDPPFPTSPIAALKVGNATVPLTVTPVARAPRYDVTAVGTPTTFGISTIRLSATNDSTVPMTLSTADSAIEVALDAAVHVSTIQPPTSLWGCGFFAGQQTRFGCGLNGTLEPGQTVTADIDIAVDAQPFSCAFVPVAAACIKVEVFEGQVGNDPPVVRRQLQVFDPNRPFYTTPPTITIFANNPYEASSPAGAAVEYFVGTSVPSSPNAELSPGRVECDRPNFSMFPVGSTPLTCRAFDAVGNASAPTTVNVEVTADRALPITFAPIADVLLGADGPDGTLFVPSTPFLVRNGYGNATTSCDVPPTLVFPIGTTPVPCTAEDEAGNVGTITYQVIVRSGPPTATPAAGPAGTVRVETPNGTTQTSVSVRPLTGSDPAPPAGVTFPNGLVSFTIAGVPVGATVAVDLALPIPATTYWKTDGTSWYALSTQLAPNGLRVFLTDGGLGDADGIANGVIVDPGAPGSAPSADPTAVADSATTDEDTSVVIDVLSNDVNPATGTSAGLEVSGVVTEPTKGTVSCNTTSCTYTPAPNANGSDSFVYSIRTVPPSGTATTISARVDVTIRPVNDPPVAQDDTDEGLENAPVPVDVLTNDSDVDGDVLTATAGTPSAGSASCSGAVCTVTPPESFTGTITVPISVSDGTATANSTLRVTFRARTATGSTAIPSGGTLGVALRGGTALDVRPATGVPAAPTGLVSPFGPFSLQATGMAPGTLATFDLTPTGRTLDPATRVLVLASSAWGDLPSDGSTGAQVVPGSGGTSSIRVAVRDGGRGDADGVADGRVSITVLPTLVAPPPPRLTIQYSTNSERTPALALDGATVSGRIAVFVPDDGTITSVRFLLDGALVRVERVPAFDLNGTASTGRANLLSTRLLRDGTHVVRAEILFKDGTTATREATFTVSNPRPATRLLMVSGSSNRSGATPLAGATVSGPRAVFVPAEPDLVAVEFRVDGRFVRIEAFVPFDLGSTAENGTARMVTFAPGARTVTARLVFSDGFVDTLTATFTAR
jgi:hypothetical protein